MKVRVENFEVLKSTSSELEVKIMENVKLVCQRHSNRRTGSSCWESFFMKYGKYKERNPLGGISEVEGWYILRGNSYKGVVLRKTWSYKKDIIQALNLVPVNE